MAKISRRDFLKLASVFPAALTLGKLFPSQRVSLPSQKPHLPNIIFLVFDAMSAYNLSLYNYPRKTTPNLERFAKRATVYHSHYSAANFTVPGTSSMLTGMYPWTHRALQLSGLVARDLADRNIFNLLGGDFHRLGFSQNVLATNLLNQFRAGIDDLMPSGSFSELSLLTSEWLKNSAASGYQVQDSVLFDFVDAPGSLIFGLAHRLYFERVKKTMFDRDFPRGIPQARNDPIIFRLEHVFDGLMNTLDGLPEPNFSYIHIFSPHAPYRARRDFIGIFDDGWNQVRKPEHAFTEGESYEVTERNRVWYDEYIANVDFEFGRLLDHLEQSGRLDNSYLIVTSDHGELLERGVKGHVTPLLYEPLVRVPLLISSPGQTQGLSVHSPTVSVDLLSTLLNLAGREIPSWVEGKLLPGLGGSEEPERAIFMLEAKSSSAFRRLAKVTLAMRKGRYKIIFYRGYDVFEEDVFEFYDLENDPEEMDDLSNKLPGLAGEFRGELMRQLEEVNEPFSV